METVERSILPAQAQTTIRADELLHSGNCGLLIHRVGQVAYEFRQEAREFARALQGHNNAALHPYVTALLFEEVLGVEERLHWLIHMKNPNDYGRLLEMVEHDSSFKDISAEDRLPERGGGNWERMFAEGSFQETVIVPQHGLTHADDHEIDGLFAAPARFQVPQPPAQQLTSASALVIVHRTAQVRYAFRKEGRQFAYDWQDRVNRRLAGRATVYLYEETWGTQDRIHWLIHLLSLDDYRAILDLGATDPELRALLTADDLVPAHRGGGSWGRMFLDGSIRDTVLLPLAPAGG